MNSDGTVDQDKYNQYLGISLPEQDSSEKETPENVILLGARSTDYKKIYKLVNAFNGAQSDYTVEVRQYETTDAMFLDLVRGQGCDLLLLLPLYLTTLSDKDGLEDLTPYFEKSEKVSRGDLFDAVLEAGTVGGKLMGVMNGFTVDAILVEKGYTEDGGWTIEEYLALMDKYPDVPLSQWADLEEASIWMMYELSALPEAFVNWDERTCDFESETFIQTIETLKSYVVRCQKPNNVSSSSIVNKLYQRIVQTTQITVGYGQCFSDYRDIRNAFLESYDLAGFPNLGGEARYPMQQVLGETLLYSMNAASAKKDAVWAFLEYMLSEYQETMAEKGDEGFPVRQDIVERKLQEEVEAELKAFFAGDKTAEETARIIQNRVTTYLSE